jgi:hypothetical protein
MDEHLYSVLDKGWKSTCRVLFGRDIGELREYDEWLSEYIASNSKRKSCFSGKEISVQNESYPENARFMSSGEISDQTMEPLTIDEIKDIDSIVEAVSGKWAYSGNKILGNSKFIESSDLVVDSQYISGSGNMTGCSYAHSCFNGRLGSKYTYGAGYFGASQFVVRTFACFQSQRIFESIIAIDSSDLYFTHNCIGCSNLMFSFFQRNKRNMIGNLELSRKKYLELKKKLLDEILDEMIKEKGFPSLAEIVRDEEPETNISLERKKPETSMEPVEKAFSDTSKIIFGKELNGIAEHENWLSKDVGSMKKIKTPFGRETYLPQSPEFHGYGKLPEKRIVTFEEGLELGKKHLEEKDVQSVGKIRENLENIGFFSTELLVGTVKNRIKCPIVYYGINTYCVYDATHSENLGVCSFVGDSKNVFGSGRVLGSEFCINCYHSINLKRCFEVDTSARCSDSYFCHNCEGISSGLFCFNAKGLRNAVGNLSLERSKYSEIKASLISQLGEELEKNKEVSLDIFSIVPGGGKKLWRERIMKN